RGAPAPDAQAHEVRFADVRLTMGPRRVALWTTTLQNTNHQVAYRDVLYRTIYVDSTGRGIGRRSGYVKDLFQPGAVVELELNDGIVRSPFTSATLEVIAASALLP